MRTIGIDIAGENSPNGLCWITWSASNATILDLQVEKKWAIQRIATTVDAWRKTDPDTHFGIDAPFGFPAAFSDAVSAMAVGRPRKQTGSTVWRFTEELILKKFGQKALSSITDQITNTVADRCYPLRQSLVAGNCLDLVGYSTRIFEVYPRIALRFWALSSPKVLPSYRTRGPLGNPARWTILKNLGGIAPWLRIPDSRHRDLLISSDDAVDALVSAIVARVAAQKTHPTAPAGLTQVEMQLVTQEGWIHVPGPCSLTKLP